MLQFWLVIAVIFQTLGSVLHRTFTHQRIPLRLFVKLGAAPIIHPRSQFLPENYGFLGTASLFWVVVIEKLQGIDHFGILSQISLHAVRPLNHEDFFMISSSTIHIRAVCFLQIKGGEDL